jgi:hypothetical protein
LIEEVHLEELRFERDEVAFGRRERPRRSVIETKVGAKFEIENEPTARNENRSGR